MAEIYTGQINEIVTSNKKKGKGSSAASRLLKAVASKGSPKEKSLNSAPAKSAPKAAAAPTTAAPQSSEPYVDPYAGKMTSALNRRFDLLRSKAEGQATAQAQQAEEASRREMASRGRIGSGAAQKQLALQQKDLAGQKADMVSDIESQREMGLAQIGEQEAARGFARAERLGTQEYGTSERLGSQEFQQRELDRQAQFKDRSMKQEARQFDKSMALEMQKFKLDEIVSKFNMDMATKMWNKKDIMEAFANMWGFDPRTGGDSNTGLGKIMGEGGLGAPSPW